MPKNIVSLTAKKIEGASPDTILYDGGGLQITMTGKGTGRWALRYTRPDGRRNMYSLGKYPLVSLAAARSLAQHARDMLADNIDPANEKRKQKVAQRAIARDTFKAVAEDWYDHKSKGWAKETARKARETLDDYLYPRLASKPIATISTADIKPALLAVHARGPRLAIKARQYCNQIIEYAIQEGLREDGRLLSLRGALPRTAKSHYAAVTRTAELPKLIKAIQGITSIYSRVAILVCLYTASRPGVVAGMRWDEIDFSAAEWHIPAERMKTGNDHITPLPRQLIQHLRILKPLTAGSPFVFPGFRSPMTSHLHRDTLSKILRENGLRKVTVAHGFRATFRTIAREKLKGDPDVLEAQLAHAKRDEIQAAYDRTQFLEERHVLIQQWADYLDTYFKDMGTHEMDALPSVETLETSV